MKTPQRPQRLKTASWIGLLGLVTISMMDLSSYCHPSEGAKQLVTQVKSASLGHAEALAANAVMSESAVEISETSQELTWRALEDVEFKDVLAFVFLEGTVMQARTIGAHGGTRARFGARL